MKEPTLKDAVFSPLLLLTRLEIPAARNPSPLFAFVATPPSNEESPEPIEESLLKELTTVFVAVPTFPPAVANCPRASVILSVFSLICGASCMAVKNFFTSAAKFSNCDAVLPVLSPAFANREMDCTNMFMDSEGFAVNSIPLITFLKLFPSFFKPSAD